MSEPTLDQLARRAAQSAARRPDYLAAVLAAYQGQEQLDDAALANHLGLPESELPWLRLCLRPRAESFAADVQAIAARFQLNELALARIVRQVDALATFTEMPVRQESGWLAAAREQDAVYDGKPADGADSDEPADDEPKAPTPERD